MTTQLDHLYPSKGGGSSGNLTALQNQVNSLSQIAAKTNLDNRFTTNQTIPSVTITGPIDANNKAATKQYVDNKFNYTLLQEWSGNMRTTSLTWNKNTEFGNSGTGVYSFQVRIFVNNKYNFFEHTFKIDNLSGVWISPIHRMDLGNEDASRIHSTIPNRGIAFVYSNKNIRILRYGNTNDFPENATIHIHMCKVW